MILTRKQAEGLNIALNRYWDQEKYTIIAGYAGTGKSTLVRFIIQALDTDPARVCYATFTGKAAEVLRKKGNENAMTLHKLLYNNELLPNGKYRRTPKKTLPFSIIVVDEISMVPNYMIDLLFSHHCYIIGLGDPFQLPPIDPKTDNHLLDNPHIFLDEIMRQAMENDIIRISMDIRAQRNLNLFSGNDVKIISRKQYEREMLLWADQILVATNASRINCNNCMREMLGYDEFPAEGDKVVCLKNEWDTISDFQNNALVNGTIGYLSHPQINEKLYFPWFLKIENNPISIINTNIITEDNDKFSNLYLDQKRLIEGLDSLKQEDIYTLHKHRMTVGDLVPKTFDYGYAITCHKAQGSQWSKVFILEEKFPFPKEDHARWLYTAITRAEEQAIIVRNV